MNDPVGARRVHWAATADLDLLGVDPASYRWDAAGGTFADPMSGWRFRPAPVLTTPDCDGARLDTWITELPEDLGTELVLLMQAGAHAAGLWVDDELIAHRADKRYVVRGNGKAQPTHLKTRGKSRYGSRLRLQNAKALDADTVDLLCTWHEEWGAFDAAWVSCAPRAWSAFKDLRPAPPLEGVQIRRIPLDVAGTDVRRGRTGPVVLDPRLDRTGP